MIDWVKQLEQRAQNVVESNNAHGWGPQLQEAINDLGWHLNLLRQSRKEKEKKEEIKKYPDTWVVKGFNFTDTMPINVEGEPFAMTQFYSVNGQKNYSVVVTKQKKEGI